MKTIEDIPPENITDKDTLGIINLIKQGIHYSSFERVYKQLPFTLEQWAHFLDTSTRTLQRWKKADASLPRLYAERVIDIYQLYKFGVEVFGNEGFNKWLISNIAALDNKEPVSFLYDSHGIQLIRTRLGRIQHGILA